MEMQNTLPGVLLAIGDNAIAGFSNALVARQLCGNTHEPCEERPVIFSDRIQVRDVALGDEKNMDRRLRADISKSENLVIVIDDFGRNLVIHDLAKEALCHTRLLLLCLTNPINHGSKAPQFFLDLFIAAIEVVDPLDEGLPLSH